MHTQEEIIERIRIIVKDILPRSSHIYLYGSRARGTASENSDWDVLIILDKPQIEQTDYDNVSYPITSLGWELGEMIIPILYTTEEWGKNSITPFFKNVGKEKIMIA